jgi:hypothetical protein
MGEIESLAARGKVQSHDSGSPAKALSVLCEWMARMAGTGRDRARDTEAAAKEFDAQCAGPLSSFLSSPASPNAPFASTEFDTLGRLNEAVTSELHQWQLELARLPADVVQALIALRDTCAQVRDALLEFDAAVEPAAAFASAWGDDRKRTCPSTGAFDLAHKAAAQLEYELTLAQAALTRAAKHGDDVGRLEEQVKATRRAWIAAQAALEQRVLALAFKSLDFPELRLRCPAAKLGDVVAAGDARSATRSRAMYDNSTTLHMGRHTVESVEFGGVRVVLKKFHVGADQERVAFLKEARRLRQLAHPNVLVLNLVFIEAQAGYLELEFCELGHLWQWLERAPPRTFGERVTVLQQALRGLEHVHRAGVVHCDVKPENIFVSGAGVANGRLVGSALKVVLNISDGAGLMWCEQNKMVNVSAR